MKPYKGSRIFWDMKSRQTILNDGWYARMIQLQDGRLLAASESGWNVIVTYSDDMGETWSPQETIFTHPAGLNYFDVDLIQLSYGKIIITYNTGFPDFNIRPDGKWGVRLRISENNGAEFAQHQLINKALNGVVVYFADPYSSWQKGLVEYTNKLIRQYIPKASDFGKFSSSDIMNIQKN